MITGPADVPADWNGHGGPALSARDVDRIRATYARTPAGRAGQRQTPRGNVVRLMADTYGVSLMTIYRALRPGYGKAHCPTCRCRS